MQITICLSALHDEWHAYPLNMCVPYSRETEILSDVESCAWDVPGRTGNLRLIRSQNQPLRSLHRILLCLLRLRRCLVKYDVCVHVLAV